MNEWKNIIMLYKLYKATTHVLVCKVGRKTYVLLSRFLFWSEAISQNHIHFPLIQVLKNSMTWHFLTFTSPSSKLEFVHPLCCGVEEQMLIFSSSLTPGRVKGSWNPIPKLTIVLMWKTPACFKFGQTSNRAVENFLQRKLWVWAANNARSYPPNFLVFFIWVVRGAMHSGKKWCRALWWNAMHSGKKWWIREFVPPYIFLSNPDYRASRSLRSLRSND